MKIVEQKRHLNKYINSSKVVFLMAHKDLDLDALGSCIGLSIILKQKRKDCYIIIDDKTHELGVEKILNELEGCIPIIRSENIDKYLYPNNKRNLLIILDTNKQELVQNKEVLKKIDKKVVIDHHELGKTTIHDAFLINDPEVSSTCEIVTELTELYDIELDPYYATLLLSGIVLDTNNFTLNTTAETYYTAYYLANLGASAKKVQYLLKQNIEEYTERQKLLTDIERVGKKCVFTKASAKTIYRKDDLAKVADTLLFFNNIEASFVIGKIDKNTIGVSARSLGNFDISKVLETLGGGGTDYQGAAQIENETLSKVEQELKKAILQEEGE